MRTIAILPLLLASFLALPACNTGIGFPLPDFNDNAGNNPNDNVGPTQQTVLVRFLNLTEFEAVDVEFHLSDAPLTAPSDELFTADNLITANIGVGGTGLLQPGTGDEVTFNCGEDLVLGTRGGIFVDNESGEERGTGQARWVEEGPISLCGGTVTFWFASGGDGFVTRVTVE